MDKQQNSVLIAVIAFNVVIIGYQYLFNWDPFSWLRFLLGAFLASIAAGVAFAVAAMKK
jgi:cell shape-determining protein MreD